MSKLREAAEELSRAWRGASLSEMILAVHKMDDALTESAEDGSLLEAAVLAEREACAKIVEQYCGAWDDAGYALSQAVRTRGKE